MPYIPVAHNRTLAEKETVTIEGDEVKLYVFAEEYRYQYWRIRSLIGWDTDYTMRHIRVEAPEYYHSREDPDDVSLEEQKNELLDEVRSAKRKKKNLAERVM